MRSNDEVQLPKPSTHSYARIAGAAVFVASLSLHTTVLAHDPPQGTGVFEQGTSVLLRTNRGLVTSADGVTDFQLLCNEALDINTAEVPSIVALGDGRWLIATSHGAMIAQADLCALTPVMPIDTVAITALAPDPTSPGRVLASTGQSDYENGLFLSTDDAKSFDVYGDRDTNRLYDAVIVAASDPQKVYASGLRIREGVNGFLHFFAASTDGGKSFVEHELVLHDDEYAIELLGVDPTNADTVFGVAHADLGTGVKDRFLIGTDAAKSFREALTVDKLEASAMAADGGALLVGARDGLWRSLDRGKTFTRIQSAAVHCLAWTSRQLYVCDDLDGKAGLSISADRGETLTRVMSFTDVTSTVPCAQEAQAHVACAGPWLDWQRELGAGFIPDASVPTLDASAADSGKPAAADDASVVAPMNESDSKSGCSCSTLGGTRRSGMGWMVLAQSFALALLARRRRVTLRRAQSRIDDQGEPR